MDSNTAQSKTYHRTIGPSDPTTSAPESEFSLLGGAIVKPKKRTLDQLTDIDKYKFNKPIKTGEKKVPLILQAFKANKKEKPKVPKEAQPIKIEQLGFTSE